MKTILMLYYYLFIVLHCWGLLCLLIYVPTREVTCITLSRKKKSIPNQQLYVCRRLSHTNLEWTLKMTIALWIQKYFKIKRILEESHTSILEPNGNMEKWIKNLINKSNNKVWTAFTVFVFKCCGDLWLCEREEGTRVTCPRFHSVNYLSIVINQLIIMTNQNILQLVLIILTNQNTGGRSGRFATHQPLVGPTFTPPSSTTHPVSPTEKRCANLILHRKIFYQSQFLLQFLSSPNRNVHEIAWTSPKPTKFICKME